MEKVEEERNDYPVVIFYTDDPDQFEEIEEHLAKEG